MNNPEPAIRLLDRCKWQPWAYINDYGLPLLEVPTMLFSHVVIPARSIILAAMGRR